MLHSHSRLSAAIGGAILALAYLTGCGVMTVPDAISANGDEVDRIRNNTSLSVQERRRQLGELGLSQLTINALLQSERLGNQFGGDLRSAHAKIAGGQFDQLTPDEIQFFVDAVRIEDPTITVQVTDANAQATRDLFVNQRVRNTDELSQYLSDPGNELPAGIPDGLLGPVFVDFDPDRVIDQIE